MLEGPIVAALLVFVYYAVTFTKFVFDGIARPTPDRIDQDTGLVVKGKPGNPALQNGLVRLWALALGIVAAVLDGHFGSHIPWTADAMYDAVKAGAAAAIGAIITYHIGQPGFLGAFGPDTPQPNGENNVAGSPVPGVVDKPAPRLSTPQQLDATLFANKNPLSDILHRTTTAKAPVLLTPEVRP